MNRSPLYYPLNRGGDLDAGGAADLQTDIMRFMAILALCLVAVFALVQSIPPEAVTPLTVPAPAQLTASPVTPPPKPPAEAHGKELAPPASLAIPEPQRTPEKKAEQPLNDASRRIPPAEPKAQNLTATPVNQLPVAIPRPTPALPPRAPGRGIAASNCRAH